MVAPASANSLARRRVGDRPYATSAHESAGRGSRGQSGMGDKQEQVLVVDDDPTVATYLAGCIKDAGYRAMVAHDISEGINLAISCQPSVVLLDCHIGERDSGLTLIKPLQQIVPNAPLVMISADTSWDLAAEALRRGAFVFWRKTNGSVDLLEAVSVAMKEHTFRCAGGRVYTLDAIERETILSRLRAHRGNISQTARDLGRSFESISALMDKHGIPRWDGG